MKNVLLIGDSIRLGYQRKVGELLGSNVKIYAPEENCRFAKYALWTMVSWMEKFDYPKIDVGHFNAGVWDQHRCTADGEIFTSLDDYAKDIRRLAIQMKSYTNNVIFANTTPGGKALNDKVPVNPLINTDDNYPKVYYYAPTDVWNESIAEYNKRAEAVVTEMGIPVNDMYAALIKDTDKYISKDGLHPTPDGYELLARLTAEQIEEML